MPTISLLKLIRDGQWQDALFTTYALSLSFFESQILKPGLARRGCRSIHILCDLDGYASCLSERLSQRVGTEYQVTPLALRAGVFHPKIAYLAGRDGDVVLVGSGNLTFGGYGRNVEVFEILTSARDAGAFRDLAGFFEGLPAKSGIALAEPESLRIFAERARAVPFDPAAAHEARLLHTVATPISDQVLASVADHGGATKVRALSPFFDPDAAGIIEFAEVCGAKELTIGILKGQENRSTFPFGNLSGNRALKLQAAEVESVAPERTLHAKWLELDLADGMRLTITGSVNATRKSLTTADNIEVALMRIEDPKATPSWSKWTPIPIPTKNRTSSYRSAGIGTRLLIHAELLADGVVNGRLFGSGSLAGEWEMTIEWPDGAERRVPGDVAVDGAFTCRFAISPDDLIKPGPQLTIRRGDRFGRAWLHVISLLKLQRRGFLNASALLRLVGGAGSFEDEAELTRYLAAFAHDHLDVFSVGFRQQRKEESATHDDTPAAPMTLVELKASSSISEGSEGSGDAGATHFLNQILQRVRRSVFAQDEQERDSEEEDEESEKSSRKPKKPESDDKDREQVCSELDAKLGAAVDARPPDDKLSGLFAMWLELGVMLRRKAATGSQSATGFARSWLHRLARATTFDRATDILRDHALVVAAVLSAKAATWFGEETLKCRRYLSVLHLDLRHLNGGKALDPSIVSSLTASAESWMGTHLAPDVASADLPTVIGNALHQLDLPSEAALAIKDASQLDEPLLLWETSAGKELRHAIEVEAPPRCALCAKGTQTCPGCHLRLPTGTYRELGTDGITWCPNCNRLLLENS